MISEAEKTTTTNYQRKRRVILRGIYVQFWLSLGYGHCLGGKCSSGCKEVAGRATVRELVIPPTSQLRTVKSMM